MSERIAVVCAREGVDVWAVTAFMGALWQQQPDSILISGGATPEKQLVEDYWLANGGPVVSWRTRKLGDETYSVVRWEGSGGAFQKVWTPAQEPTWRDASSAFHYRDILIAEECERLVAFFGQFRSRGAGFTAAYAKDIGRDVYEYLNA